LILAVIGTLVGAVIVLAIGLAVLRAGTEPAAGDAGETSGSSVSVGTGVGQRAPDFRLVDIDGSTVTRDSLRGKPALLWFTASYCAPCNEAMPVLKRILEPLGPDAVKVVIVFVDPGEAPETLRKWQATIGSPDWTAALASAPMIRDYGLQYLDTKYLLDADGVIRETDFVPLREEVWRRAIEKVVRGA
jgi:cytochrome oxidase Cu insertion factor (SCO1/SenC/PrrC family)